MSVEPLVKMERTTVKIEGDRNLYRYEFCLDEEPESLAGTLGRIDMGASETE